MRKPFQSPGRMKNLSYYISPAGDRTHNLPHTVASNMVNVSYAPITTRHGGGIPVPTLSFVVLIFVWLVFEIPIHRGDWGHWDIFHILLNMWTLRTKMHA